MKISHRIDIFRPDCPETLCFVDPRCGVVYYNRAARVDAMLIVILHREGLCAAE